jgi:hypothetical protein
MGLEIKRNAKGKYQLKSTISDEKLHKDWITEDEAKKILIEREYWRFIEETIKIYLDFPNGCMVNGKYEAKNFQGNKFIIEHWNDGKIEEKYKEIISQLNIVL